MKVRIQSKDSKKHGYINYDPNTREVLVTYPDESGRKLAYHYLTNPFVFTTPSKGGGINHEESMLTPCHSINNMTVALCELHSHSGLKVDWSHSDNSWSTGDPNAKSDKPILKGIDGNDYELL